MATDGDIELYYLLTAEMLSNCFTKLLPKPACLKLCAAMGMIGIGLSNGPGNSLRIKIGLGNGDGIGNAIRQ